MKSMPFAGNRLDFGLPLLSNIYNLTTCLVSHCCLLSDKMPRSLDGQLTNRTNSSQIKYHIPLSNLENRNKQDLVSSMQKTGWSIHSSFLILLSGFHFGCDHYEAVNNHFPVYWAIFGVATNEQTNDQ